MKKLFLMCMIVGLTSQILLANNAPISTVGTIVITGSTATVPVTATNFTNILSCNLKLSYNPALFTVDSVGRGPLLGGSLSVDLTVSGTISLGWFNYPAVTLTGNPVIFNIYIKNFTGCSAAITWSDNGYSCIWYDGSYNVLTDTPTGTYYINGLITGDVVPPVLANVPSDVTVSCSSIPAPGTPTATDNCDPNPAIHYLGQVSTQDPNALLLAHYSYTLTRTWDATDVSGNHSLVGTQVITVHDVTIPLLAGVPVNTTVDCDAIPGAGTPTAGDNCDPAPVVHYLGQTSTQDPDILLSAHYNYTLTRTWDATDVSGNHSLVGTQVITVHDVTRPLLAAVPVNITVDCDAIPGPGTPTANDNCDPAPVVHYLGQVSTQDPNTLLLNHYSYTLTRTWDATDVSGNHSLVGTQVITVHDVTRPLLAGVPVNTMADCDAIPGAGTPTANDNCDPAPVVHYLGEVSTQDPNALLPAHYSYTLTRTWDATDVSGNHSLVGTQVITVHDVTKPLLAGVPVNTTVDCDAIPGPGTPTANDNCDPNPVIHYLGQVSTQDPNVLLLAHYSYTLTRTWDATDVSGNHSLVGTQLIIVHDVTKPLLAGVPVNTTVDCDAIPGAGTPTANDNCDPAPVVHYLGQTSTQDPNTLLLTHYSYAITRTWNATDVSGNTSLTGTQVITVHDVTKPLLAGVPVNTTGECDAIPGVGAPTANDNCDPNPVVHYLGEVSTQNSDPADPGHYNYTLTRTWNATDVSGNISLTGIQVVTIHDGTAPGITCPVPLSLYDKNNGCAWTGSGLSATMTDNCDPSPSIYYSTNGGTTYTPGDANGYPFPGGTTTVTYKAVDHAGNSTTCSFVIHVRPITLSGHVSYYNAAGTKMNFIGVTLQQAGFTDITTTTDADGNYTFPDVCLGAWNVVFNTDIPGHVKTAGDINATDAGLVNIWGTGTQSYEIEKVQFYAGDVVTDNLNNSADAARILQYFVSLGSPPWYTPPCCLRSAWTFWTTGSSADRISANPPTPIFSALLPGVTVPVSSVTLTQNFLGLSTGDYNHSWTPSTSKSAGRTLQLTCGPTRYAKTGEEFDLPVSATSALEVGAVSLIITFPQDKLEILGVTMAGATGEPALYNVSGNQLRIGWTSLDAISLKAAGKLLTLRVKLTGTLEKDETIRLALADDHLNELADARARVIQNAVLVIDGIGSYPLGIDPAVTAESLRFANYPNPFAGTTTFSYSLPAAGDVRIDIRNMVGLVVYSISEGPGQVPGDHSMVMNEDALPAGVYMASLKVAASNGELIMRTIKIIKTY